MLRQSLQKLKANRKKSFDKCSSLQQKKNDILPRLCQLSTVIFVFAKVNNTHICNNGSYR
jgi:hypothetical protein